MLLNSKLFLDRELAISIILSSFIIGIGFVLKWAASMNLNLQNNRNYYNKLLGVYQYW